MKIKTEMAKETIIVNGSSGILNPTNCIYITEKSKNMEEVLNIYKSWIQMIAIPKQCYRFIEVIE